MGKKILGISAFYHDSAAAILLDGQVIAAVQEERFTREKHTAVFPVESIKYCLEEAGLTIDELDAVVFYDKPLLKFERLLQTYYTFAPRGVFSFLKAMPVWMHEKLFLKNQIYKGLKKIERFDKKKLRLLFPEHHLSHAASAFYASLFEQAAILTIDGVGEWSTASIAFGKGADITMLRQMEFPHSLGLLYSAFTYYLGFRVNSGEYKLMGLAPFGNPESEETRGFTQKIKTELIDLKEDGSIWLNQAYFKYATGLRMIRERKWNQLFGLSRRVPESEFLQVHANLALAIQQLTEEIVIRLASTAKGITKAKNLCLAGGVALNGVANGKLYKSGIFEKIYIQPAAGDAGGALGAAQAANYLYFKEKRELASTKDRMQGTFLGPAFSAKEIQNCNKKVKATSKQFDDFEDLTSFIANELSKGKIVGWFQGRMEFGPRALGNRSILADARDPQMQEKLNRKIKFRESFRPFAPAILEAYCSDYFELNTPSPYMSLVVSLKEKRQLPLPNNYFGMSLMDRLAIPRSDIPAVTHLDFSARVQTVHEETNPRFKALLQAFAKKTGCPLLINTSFNLRGEPIVANPMDAYRCFMSTEMDFLVIGDYVYDKKEQTGKDQPEKWRQYYRAD